MTKADHYTDRINKLEKQMYSLMEVVETLAKQPNLGRNTTLTNTENDLTFTKEPKEKTVLTDC